jgi:hypothetical protein
MSITNSGCCVAVVLSAVVLGACMREQTRDASYYETHLEECQAVVKQCEEMNPGDRGRSENCRNAFDGMARAGRKSGKMGSIE